MPEYTSIVAADPELDQYSLHRSHGSESRSHHRRAHLIRGCLQAQGLETRSWSCRVSVAVANNHEGCPRGTPTRWFIERKVYHERNLPDATVLTEARRTPKTA
ncbi:unnamed protein product [Ectocarpus fasciculatus]